MMARVLGRALAALLALWLVATGTFALLRLAPGGPFHSERAVPAAARAELARRYRLDRPLARQYLDYLGALARLELGPSYHYPDRQVAELLSRGLPVSLELGLWALAIALALGVPLGLAAAAWHRRALGQAMAALAALAAAVPAVVLGHLLVHAIALERTWLPAGLWQGASSRVLPVLTLALAPAAALFHLTRAGALTELSRDYLRTARAKGRSWAGALLVHALRPALRPPAAALAPVAARLLTGSIVVEQLFALPGVGRYLVTGALHRDYPLVTGAVLLYAALLLALSALCELAFGWLDPQGHGA